MDILGGFLKALTNPTTLLQLATGPAGWASLAMRTIGTSIIQQALQQVGQQLGLPSSMINLAQQAFSASSGTGDLGQQTTKQAISGLAKQFNLSATQEGQLGRQANDSVSELVDSMMKKVRQGGNDEETGSANGESRLVTLAKIMGKLLDKKMDGIISKSRELDGDKANGGKNQATLSAEITALSQEMNFISNALNTSIKSIGEALSTLARKS